MVATQVEQSVSCDARQQAARTKDRLLRSFELAQDALNAGVGEKLANVAEDRALESARSRRRPVSIPRR
jgi:hypothetical protein